MLLCTVPRTGSMTRTLAETLCDTLRSGTVSNIRTIKNLVVVHMNGLVLEARTDNSVSLKMVCGISVCVPLRGKEIRRLIAGCSPPENGFLPFSSRVSVIQLASSRILQVIKS